MSQLIDTRSAGPLRIQLIRAGITESHIADAVDEYFATRERVRISRETASAIEVGNPIGDLPAEEITARITASRDGDALVAGAQAKVMAVLGEHYDAWQAAAHKARDRAAQQLAKLLPQVLSLLDDLEIHGGTAQGLDNHIQLQWKPSAEFPAIHDARTALQTLAAKLAQ